MNAFHLGCIPILATVALSQAVPPPVLEVHNLGAATNAAVYQEGPFAALLFGNVGGARVQVPGLALPILAAPASIEFAPQTFGVGAFYLPYAGRMLADLDLYLQAVTVDDLGQLQVTGAVSVRDVVNQGTPTCAMGPPANTVPEQLKHVFVEFYWLDCLPQRLQMQADFHARSDGYALQLVKHHQACVNGVGTCQLYLYLKTPLPPLEGMLDIAYDERVVVDLGTEPPEFVEVYAATAQTVEVPTNPDYYLLARYKVAKP